MFEGLLERLLNKILGQFIEDFSSDNLHVGIWSGEVILSNIVLKREIIRRLNLPFMLKYSRLGCLKMNIPFKSLTSSKIEILIEGLQIIVAQLPHSQWECKNHKIIEARKEEIKNICQSVLADFVKKEEKLKESEEGYFSKLIVKIIDNIQVTIKDIHIRYEGQLANTYSFGLTLQQLKVYTVNSLDQPEYIDRTTSKYQNQPLRKRLELYNIGIYWNQNSPNYEQKDYAKNMNASIARRGEKKLQHNYIILMTSQAKLLQRESGKQFKQPQIDLQITLQTLKIEITNNQLQQIIHLGERLQRYKREVKEKNTKELSNEERNKLVEDFCEVLPYYSQGWGKDLSKEQLEKLENVLEKMEVYHFIKYIKQHLQKKQRQRIIKEKQQKGKSWFWGKPKELSAKQLDQIQNYLNDNFAKEVVIVKRPLDYYHININFKLQKLEIVVANTLAIIKEGLISEFSQLSVGFKLRQGGYLLNLGLQDIKVKMFKQKGVESIQFTDILYKILPAQSTLQQKQYIRMQVQGNPLDKKHLNTDIKLITSELMFVFYPKMITIATQFAGLKLSKENKEAALQKYGEIKEKTTNAVSQSLQEPKQQLIGADLLINSITIALPFDPKQPNRQCWGLSLGSIQFTTDEQTLKRKEIRQDLPMDVFKMNLKAFSFRQYESLVQLQNFRKQIVKQIDHKYAVIDNLDFGLALEIYNKATEKTPKIRINAQLPVLSVNLNALLYRNLLKMDKCFDQERNLQLDRTSMRIVQKDLIKQKATKIGMVYIKDGVTQIWKKYVAIMSENYIYIYLNTKDENYYAYYYIKKATLERSHQPKDKEKPHQFKIKNSLNEVTFGFDKPENIDDWEKKIQNLSKTQEPTQSNSLDKQQEKTLSKGPKNPNALALVVFASLKKVSIQVYTTQSTQKEVIYLQLCGLQTLINLHQSKKSISLILNSISLQDSIYAYKSNQLKYFLKTQQNQMSQSLIKININQLGKTHPEFNHVDSNIDIVFGNLICNYKCETVKALMAFFIPESQEKIQLEEIKQQGDKSPIQSFVQRPKEQQESFSLKLNLKIRSIALMLVNQKTKTQVGKLGLTELVLYTGISQKRLCLKGSLKQLYLVDYSRYPNTILQELQDYQPYARSLLKANIEQEKNMLEFNIEILKVANQNHKKMLIDILLNNLTVYYTQQPILRLITYLNTQMLPSFETGPKVAKVIKPKDQRPEPSEMDLKVNLTNVSIFVQPNPMQRSKKEYLQLNVQKILVNNNVFFRGYVQSGEKIILVQNYTVQLLGMGIYTRYYDQQEVLHEYGLTNKLDFKCSTDLIANPLYYQKDYKQQFLNGLRVQCSMSPFFMGISQKDYSFIMKCLNWSITHDDGTQGYLYDIQANKVEEQQNVQQKAPFYLKLDIQCLSLFINHKKVPVVFLLLDDLKLDFVQKQEQMNIDLSIENIYGTAIQFKVQKNLFMQRRVLNERGMFNALGYQKTHQISQDFQTDINQIIKLFDRRDKIKKKRGSKPFMKFIMKTRKQQSFISIEIDELILDIDVKILLILGTVTTTEQSYIKGPVPIRQKQVNVMMQLFPKLVQNIDQRTNLMLQKKNSTFNIIIQKLVSSISDQHKQKFIVFQGELSFSITSEGQRDLDQLTYFFDNSEAQKLLHSQIIIQFKNLTLYFCKIKEGEIINKREILKPVAVFTEIKKAYDQKYKMFVLSTEIQAKVGKLIFFSSFVDFINIDIIIKDNLKAFEQEKPPPKQEATDKILEEVSKQANNAIQNRLNLTGSFEPIQFQLVNDCNSNFMPVLRLLIQDLNPFMDQYLIKTHITAVPLLSLYFFNPRSSKWQPIIEPFQLSLVYLVLLTQNGQNVKFIVESKPQVQENQIPAEQQREKQRQVQNKEEADIQTDILRINISTQMLSTLLAAKEMAMKYKKKLQNVNLAIVDFIMNQKDVKQQEQLQIQVSPFIFQNVTNELIFLEREQKEFQLDPFFKGSIKLDNDRQIKFRLKGEQYIFGLDHFGTLRISNSTYFIQYDVQKLNRLIRFIPSVMIQNKLLHAVYIKREGKVSNVPKKIQIGEKIPLDNIESFAVSLNGNSYTDVVAIKDIYNINCLTAANKKFNIQWSRNMVLNKYEVFQLISPFVVHNCIPKSLSLQFISKAKTLNTKVVPNQTTHEVYASEVISQIQFKISYPGYNWTKKFKFEPEKDGEQRSIVLQDESNGVTHLNFVFQKIAAQNKYVLTIYCKKIIVNELHDKLIIYGNSAEDQKNKKIDSYKLLGGQRKNDPNVDDKVVLIGSQVGDKLRICGVNSMFDFATPVAIGGLGQSQSRIVVDRNFDGKPQSVFSIIGVTISLMKMSYNCDIYCKKIVLTNKSIICNNTSRDLVLREEFAKKFSSFVPKGQRQNAIFGLPEIKDKLHYGYIIQTEGFERSKVFILPEEGSVYAKLLSKQINPQTGQKSVLYLYIRVKTVDLYKFYEISEVSEENLPYEVITKSKYLRVTILKENKSIRLGESYKFMKQASANEQLQLQLEINHQFSKDSLKVKVYPDDLNFKLRENLKVKRQTISGEVALKVYVSFSDKTKTIVVDQVHNVKQKTEVEKQQIVVNLPEIIISINQNTQSVARPYESLVITLQRLILILRQTDMKTSYQFKLGFMQFDQAFPHALPNPVILTPYKFEEFTRQQKPEWVFNSLVVFNNSYKQTNFIDQVSVDFNDIVVKFSLDFLNLVTQISKEFTEVLNYKDESHYLINEVQRWKQMQIPKQGSKTFIKTIKISPFYIDLSAELNLKKLGLQNNQFLNTIISAVGIVVSNIEDAPIRLSGMSITNCIDTADGITSKIMSRYKGDVINQLYKVFGSLNIIGNPMGLLRNISTGFQDFSKKPAKGFVNGPAEFVQGIAQGTGSLVAHSVGGAFNSLSKITGTVSTGLASFAFDKDFEQHREKEKMRRPQNVFQGLEKGGRAVLYGFKAGITGLFTQPYKSARKDGALGFVKGAAKGLAGLVVKPVTGIIDFASKTTQGIKNNALVFQDRPNYERMRYPRVFYTECFVMKEYNKIDSQIQSILMKPQNDNKFSNITYVDCFAASGGQEYLVVTRQYIAYLDVVKRKVLWSLPILQLQCEGMKEKKLLIIKGKRKASMFHSNNFEVNIQNEGQIENIVHLINSIIKEKQENI